MAVVYVFVGFLISWGVAPQRVFHTVRFAGVSSLAAPRGLPGTKQTSWRTVGEVVRGAVAPAPRQRDGEERTSEGESGSERVGEGEREKEREREREREISWKFASQFPGARLSLQQGFWNPHFLFATFWTALTPTVMSKKFANNF